MIRHFISHNCLVNNTKYHIIIKEYNNNNNVMITFLCSFLEGFYVAFSRIPVYR